MSSRFTFQGMLRWPRDILGTSRDRAIAPLAVSAERLALAIGRMEARAVRSTACSSIGDAEFRVFSQWGEDGIIQYLVSRVAIERPMFIEFGVGDYSESNTRFLLQNDHWEGLILDGGKEHLDFLAAGELQWRYAIEGRRAFLTRENINGVIRDAGVEGDIGLLSIDVDGNDYWLFDAISVVSPRILVIEYNSLFGSEAAVTIPYDAAFERHKAHFSNLYFGASLAALEYLAAQRGYLLVGCNRAGANAFFVRQDVIGDLPAFSSSSAYVPARFREARDIAGQLTLIGHPSAKVALIADEMLVDVRTGQSGTVYDMIPT